MTDEEKAEKYADWFWGASPSEQRAIEQAYLAGVKAGRPQWHKVADGELMVKASVVEELKAQIEKMKNCENCRFAYDKKHDCMPCENMEDWELME